MADFAAVEVAFPTTQATAVAILVHEFPNLWEQAYIGGVASGVSYIMRAQDSGRPAGADYITWEATTADFDGVGYVLGSPSPISTMVVGSAVVMSTLT